MFLKYVQLVRMAKFSGKVDFSKSFKVSVFWIKVQKCEISNWICFRFYHLRVNVKIRQNSCPFHIL